MLRTPCDAGRDSLLSSPMVYWGNDARRAPKFASKIFIAVLLAAGAIGGGCGLETGDLVVYRTALGESSLSGDCSSDENDSTTFRAGQTMVLYLPGTLEDGALLDLGEIVLPGTETDEGFTFQGTDIDGQEVGGQTIFDSDGDGLDDTNGEDPLVDADGDGDDDLAGDLDVDVDEDGLHDWFEDDIVDANGDGNDDRVVSLGGDLIVTTSSVSVALVLDGDTASGTFTTVTSTTCEGDCQGFDPTNCTATGDFVGVEIDRAILDTNE